MGFDSDDELIDNWAAEEIDDDESEEENVKRSLPSEQEEKKKCDVNATSTKELSNHESPARPPPSGKKKAVNQKSKRADGAKDDKGPRLRSPILCIMGHVDTGKTKLLDKMRKTNVQDKEAGGITQQIGATFFPRENLLGQCSKVDKKLDLKVPGLLIIDTPGHASFNNLRKRGSSLCDLAIVVVDIMHGLEPQTRESLQLLRQRKCPFVVALNKIDRIYGWKSTDWASSLESLKNQKNNVQEDFNTRAQRAILELTEDQGLNCRLYHENDNFRKNVSVVPTSALTGEGIPDLLSLIVRLTQDLMTKKIVLDEKNIEATILEVKSIEGLGTTIDVVLVGGVLKEGDKIVVCGMQGPIVTTIRALLTPHPLKELRVKGEYQHHKAVYAAMGVKIAANGLEGAVAGTALMVPKNAEDEEACKEAVQEDIGAIFQTVNKTQEGVYVVASTLGSLEALLDFMKESKIPVSGISIGTVYKLDVKKASTMRERGHEEYSVILAFDVKIDPEAEKEAKDLGVTIFAADIIYHLFDSFTKHIEEFRDRQKQSMCSEVIYPCILKIIADSIFNKKDPLVFGVRVDAGELRIDTPLVVVDHRGEKIRLGKVESIQNNKKPVTCAKKGQEVCIKVTGQPLITYGRHFDAKALWVVSEISRSSINVMKEHFRDDLQLHAKLVVQLKGVLGII